MKDGLYDFHFVALSRDHPGRIRVEGNMVEGGDDLHALHGQLSRAGANILASFEVSWRTPPSTGRSGPSASYTIKMFGTGTDTDFSVIGLGPLGLIVELHGTWRMPLPQEPEGEVRSDSGRPGPAIDPAARRSVPDGAAKALLRPWARKRGESNPRGRNDRSEPSMKAMAWRREGW